MTQPDRQDVTQGNPRLGEQGVRPRFSRVRAGRVRALRVTAGVGSLLLAFAFVAATASAGKFTDRLYGGPGSGINGGMFNEPRGLAVNASGAGSADPGDVYVVEDANSRVQVLDADGDFKFAFGGDVIGNEVQRITVNATGGSYTLTFDPGTTAPETTDPIAFNASASSGTSSVQTRLRALPSIGATGVGVSGSQAAGYTVTFQGTTLAGTDVAQLTADTTGLTGGAQTVTVETLVEGAGGSFTGFEKCTVASQCKQGALGTAAGVFDDPTGIAINETGAGPGDPGDVYVRDADNQRVQQFDADGNFIRMWGWGVDDGTSEFQVCEVADLPCQVGAPGSAVGQFGHPGTIGTQHITTGIAVDRTTGDVWVVDPVNGRFQRFAGDGDSGGTVPPAAHGRATSNVDDQNQSDDGFAATISAVAGTAQHIAVGLDGVVYVGTMGATAKIARFDPDAGAFLRRLGGDSSESGPPGTDGALSGVAIDPATGNLLLARRGVDTVQEFDLTDVGPDEDLEPEDLVDVHAVGFGNQLLPNGLAVDPVADEILLTTRTPDHRVAVLDDDGANPLPVVDLFPPTSVGATTATFHADIDPVLTEDFPTRYRFEVSKDGVTWTEAAPTADPDPLVGGDGFTAEAIAKAATGLEPNTFYLVRVVTSRDPAAGSSISSELVFKTDPAPPQVTTDGASGVSDRSARLNGRVNPGGLATDYWFEWGDESYGNVVPVPAATLPAGPSDTAVAEIVGGLDPESVYHFRLCAQNDQAAAPVCGADRQFTTREAVDAPKGRSYEMVTHPDKPLRQGHGGLGKITLDFARANNALPSTDGEAVRWGLFPGATSPEAGHAFTWAETYEVYDRSEAGWRASAVTNVAPAFGGTHAIIDRAGVSADLQTSAWYTTTSFFDNFPDDGGGRTGSNQVVRVMGDDGGPRGAGWYPWLDPSWYDTTGVAVDGTSWAARIDDSGERLIGATTGHEGAVSRGIAPADGGSAPQALDPPQTSGQAPFLSGPEVGWRPGDLINECTGSGTGATLIPMRDDEGTEAGPPGRFINQFATFPDESVILTAHPARDFDEGILPGHYVTGHAGIAPDTRVVSRDSDTQITIDKPTDAPEDSLAILVIGQDASKLDDDTIAAQACEEGSPTHVRGANVDGSGHLDSSSITALSDDGERVFFTSPDPDTVDRNLGNAVCLPSVAAATACPPQLFVRQYAESGQPTVRWISRAEDALFSGSPGPQAPAAMGNGVAFEGASRDGSVVYFRTNAPLLENDPNGGDDPLAQASSNSWDLYRYVFPADDSADPGDGTLTRVSAGPTATGTGTLTSGSPTVSAVDADSGTFAVGQVISGSGIPGGTSIAAVGAGTLTLSQNATASGADVALSAAADPNTNCELIATSGADEDGCSGSSSSADPNGEGGVVRFMSDDGERVYFVTAAQIPGAANNPPAGGVTTATGANDQVNTATRNLYLYDASKDGSAAYEFVARLPFSIRLGQSGDIDACTSFGVGSAGPPFLAEGGANDLGLMSVSQNCMHGTTSGDAVVLMTAAQLTADDVDSAVDVYLYDASRDQLTRISAPPPGSPPYVCHRRTPDSPVLARCNADLGFTAGPGINTLGDVVGQAGLRHWNVAEHPDGSLKAVYFQSRHALAAGDVNGAGPVDETGGEGYMDVYEWREGEVRLISTGDSPNSSFYSGNSQDGRHVFFWTEQRISAWEIDPADGDLYSAAVGNGFPDPPAPAPVCAVLGGGCHGGGAGGIAVAPQTSSPAGDGNAAVGDRKTLSVARLGRRARARAARTGRLALRVRTSDAGRLRVVVRGKVAKRKRMRVLARASKNVRRPGVTRVNLRLNRSARKALRRGRPLRISIQVRQAGARSRSMTVRLRRPRS